jgi:hypothetical protein
MARRDSPWPLSARAESPRGAPCRCALAFTVPRASLPPQATAFSQIERPETARLFQLFLEVCARVARGPGARARLLLEEAMDSSLGRATHYTFFLAVSDWGAAARDPCDAAMSAIVAEAASRASRSAPARPEPRAAPPRGWLAYSRIGRVKADLEAHSGLRVSGSRGGDSADRWGPDALGAHAAFSLPLAFAPRGRGCLEAQSVWNLSAYRRVPGRVELPLPERALEARDHDLREPETLWRRALPDWQAASAPQPLAGVLGALVGADLEAPSGLSSSLDELPPPPGRPQRRDALGRVVARAWLACCGSAVELEPVEPLREASGRTFEELRAEADARCELADRAAAGRAPWSGGGGGSVEVARRLRDAHQRVAFAAHAALMRGAFPENLSPQALAVAEWGERHAGPGRPLAEGRAPLRPGLDAFCDREAWRWGLYADVYLVAPHNLELAMLVHYCMLDSYSPELERRVGLNVLLHSADGGLGKSLLVAELPRETRIRVEAPVHQTAKALAVSGGAQREQTMRTVCMEEVPEGLLSRRASAGSAESSRFHKAMLSNGGVMEVRRLEPVPGTSERRSAVWRSLWFGVYLLACNVEWLLSSEMEPAMLQRYIVVALDESARARGAIEERTHVAASRARDPRSSAARAAASRALKAEEYVAAEYRMLEREGAVLATSDDVASLLYARLAEALRAAGLAAHASARNRDKFCALASAVALADAEARVHFDRGAPRAGEPYDLCAGQRAAEARNWVRAAHAVHAVGLAPSLFLDPVEPLARLALCAEFEALPPDEPRHPPKRDEDLEPWEEPGAEDLAYACFFERGGPRALALRLQRRLAREPGARPLPSPDALLHRMQLWLDRSARPGAWSRRAAASGSSAFAVWPARARPRGLADEPEAPIAQLSRLQGGVTRYAVQTGWIARPWLPPPAAKALRSALGAFFAARHQGGFRAPCGARRDGSMRVARFPAAPRDAPPLLLPDGSELAESVDDWGRRLHRARAHVSGPTLRPLRAPPRDGCSPRAYFSGRRVSELLPGPKLSRAEAVALLLDPGTREEPDPGFVPPRDESGEESIPPRERERERERKRKRKRKRKRERRAQAPDQN